MSEAPDFDNLMDRFSLEAIRTGGLVLSAFVIEDEETYPTVGIGICALTEAIANLAVLSMPEEADAGLVPRITHLLTQALHNNRNIIRKANRGE